MPLARFACTGCAACCRQDWRIPLTADEAARVDDWYRGSAAWQGDDGGWQLKRAGGECALLMADRRCGIHQEQGAAAKPLACRLYPFSFLRTPDGPVTMLALDCPGVTWPAAADAETTAAAQQLAAAGDPPELAAVRWQRHPVAWAVYRGWREWLRRESTGSIRPRDLLLAAARSAAALPGLSAWHDPDAEQRLDWLVPVAGEEQPLVRRRLLALALLLTQPADGTPPTAALRAWLRPGAVWSLGAAGEHPVTVLELVAEQSTADGDAVLRWYLAELLRRHLPARADGELDAGLRVMTLVARLTLLLAAAQASRCGTARIDAAAMRAAVMLVDRRFALHLRLDGAGLFAGTARAMGERLLHDPNYYASLL